MRKKGHTMIDCICPFCGISFQRTLSDYNTTLKKGGKHYCSKRCNGLAVKAKRQAESGMNEERFWNLVDKTPGQGPNGDCWEWQGRVNKKGYGVVSWRDKAKEEGRSGHIILCHRLSYELSVGMIPDGLDILHSCDNPPCVNPAHLRPGTKKNNSEDAVSRGRNAHGSKHGSTKLTEEQVEEIKLMHLIGYTHVDIAKQYSVSVDASYFIKSGKTWKRVSVDTSHKSYLRLLSEYQAKNKLKKTKSGHTQLCLEEAQGIKAMLAEGHSYHDIAGTYNTSYETVLQIKTGRTWKEA